MGNCIGLLGDMEDGGGEGEEEHVIDGDWQFNNDEGFDVEEDTLAEDTFIVVDVGDSDLSCLIQISVSIFGSFLSKIVSMEKSENFLFVPVMVM